MQLEIQQPTAARKNAASQVEEKPAFVASTSELPGVQAKLSSLHHTHGNRFVQRFVGEPEASHLRENDPIAREQVGAPGTVQRQPNQKSAPQGGQANHSQPFPGGVIRIVPKVQRIDSTSKGPEILINNPNQNTDLGAIKPGDRGGKHQPGIHGQLEI